MVAVVNKPSSQLQQPNTAPQPHSLLVIIGLLIMPSIDGDCVRPRVLIINDNMFLILGNL